MVDIENGIIGAGTGAIAGGSVGLMGGIFDPITVPAGAIIGAVIGGTTGLFSSSDETKIINQNSYISQTQYKTNDIVIGANSKNLSLVLDDKMEQKATTNQTSTQKEGINPLYLVGVGLVVLYLGGKNK